MSTQYTQQILKVIVAQVCQTIGWNSIQSTPLELLVGILHKYLQEVTHQTNRYSELYGRTEPNLDDIALAFRDMQINILDLEEYIGNVDPVPCAIDTPKFPLAKENHLNFLKPGSKEVVARPVHVHGHLPPMYPEKEDSDNDEKNVLNVDDADTEENVLDVQIVALLNEDEKHIINEASIVNLDADVYAKNESDVDFKKPIDTKLHQSRAKSIVNDPETRTTREIHSVIMTTSGFISPAREGKLPDSKAPVLPSTDFVIPVIPPVVVSAATPAKPKTTVAATTTIPIPPLISTVAANPKVADVAASGGIVASTDAIAVVPAIPKQKKLKVKSSLPKEQIKQRIKKEKGVSNKLSKKQSLLRQQQLQKTLTQPDETNKLLPNPFNAAAYEKIPQMLPSTTDIDMLAPIVKKKMKFIDSEKAQKQQKQMHKHKDRAKALKMYQKKLMMADRMAGKMLSKKQQRLLQQQQAELNLFSTGATVTTQQIPVAVPHQPEFPLFSPNTTAVSTSQALPTPEFNVISPSTATPIKDEPKPDFTIFNAVNAAAVAAASTQMQKNDEYLMNIIKLEQQKQQQKFQSADALPLNLQQQPIIYNKPSQLLPVKVKQPKPPKLLKIKKPTTKKVKTPKNISPTGGNLQELLKQRQKILHQHALMEEQQQAAAANNVPINMSLPRQLPPQQLLPIYDLTGPDDDQVTITEIGKKVKNPAAIRGRGAPKKQPGEKKPKVEKKLKLTKKEQKLLMWQQQQLQQQPQQQSDHHQETAVVVEPNPPVVKHSKPEHLPPFLCNMYDQTFGASPATNQVNMSQSFGMGYPWPFPTPGLIPNASLFPPFNMIRGQFAGNPPVGLPNTIGVGASVAAAAAAIPPFLNSNFDWRTKQRHLTDSPDKMDLKQIPSVVEKVQCNVAPLVPESLKLDDSATTTTISSNEQKLPTHQRYSSTITTDPFDVIQYRQPQFDAAVRAETPPASVPLTPSYDPPPSKPDKTSGKIRKEKIPIDVDKDVVDDETTDAGIKIKKKKIKKDKQKNKEKSEKRREKEEKFREKELKEQLKKEKREKKKERLAAAAAAASSQLSVMVEPPAITADNSAIASPSLSTKDLDFVPKLTLKLGGSGVDGSSSSPHHVDAMEVNRKRTQKKDKLNSDCKTIIDSADSGDSRSRGNSPELARISALVTRPPKQKTPSLKRKDDSNSFTTINDVTSSTSNTAVVSTIPSISTAIDTGGSVLQQQILQTPPPTPTRNRPKESAAADGATEADRQLITNAICSTVGVSDANSGDGLVTSKRRKGSNETTSNLVKIGNFVPIQKKKTNEMVAALTNMTTAGTSSIDVTTGGVGGPSLGVRDSEGNQVWICPACGRVDDGTPMIGCDGCDAWYHWVCVGIQVPPDTNEDWYCRVCIAKKQEWQGSDKKAKKRKKKEKKDY